MADASRDKRNHVAAGRLIRRLYHDYPSICLEFERVWLPALSPMYTPSLSNPQAAAAALLAVPKGSRVLILQNFDTWLSSNPLNKTKRRPRQFHRLRQSLDRQRHRRSEDAHQSWMADFVAAGGDLDRVEFDNESGMNVWAMMSAQLRAIIADPRSAWLEAQMAPWHLADALSDEPPRMRLNAILAQIVAQAMQTAEFDVVKSYFPNVSGSDYSHTLISEPETFYVPPDLNGHRQYGYSIVGTDNTWNFDGWMGQLAQIVLPGLKAPYGADAFKTLRWNINTMRSRRRSAPTIPVRPWIGYYSWTQDGGRIIQIGNTPYYGELIYHLALNGADDFLYFAPASPYGTATTADHAHLESLLEELRSRGVVKTATTTTLADIRGIPTWSPPGCKLVLPRYCGVSARPHRV